MFLGHTDGPGQIRLLRDRESILRSKPILDELVALYQQPDARDDLDYRLAYHDFSFGSQRKSPCLLLLPAGCGLGSEEHAVQGFVGAILLFEYRLPGIGLRLYTTVDTTGRRTLIAPSAHRSQMAAFACRALLAQGAQAVVMTIQADTQQVSIQRTIDDEMNRMSRGVAAEWSLTERENPVYLPLARTYDATLATIGKKTRTQLRYYRRRAEKDLSCTFIPEVEIGMEEFVAFNRQCMFAVSDEVARWRYEERSRIERPVLQGLKDGNGDWLSLVGGRRTGDFTELEWQCNRADLPASSLATVMRSYLIENEIREGIKRLYFEGGTSSSLRQSFVVEGAADLTVCRKTAYVWFVRRCARWLFPPKNQMAQIFMDPKLSWHPCRNQPGTPRETA